MTKRSITITYSENAVAVTATIPSEILDCICPEGWGAIVSARVLDLVQELSRYEMHARRKRAFTPRSHFPITVTP